MGRRSFIRSDNGPEFISHAIRQWLQACDVQTLFIEPGSPWENAYVESFNSRLRDELLDRELFTSLEEAKVVLEDHRLDYNHRRPHSSLGYLTPAMYAARLREDEHAFPATSKGHAGSLYRNPALSQRKSRSRARGPFMSFFDRVRRNSRLTGR